MCAQQAVMGIDLPTARPWRFTFTRYESYDGEVVLRSKTGSLSIFSLSPISVFFHSVYILDKEENGINLIR